MLKAINQQFTLEIRNIWAVTLDIPYYMNMHTTFEKDYNNLHKNHPEPVFPMPLPQHLRP